MTRTSRRLKGALLAGTMLFAGGGIAVLSATPAGASNKQVTTVGSFTTYQLMHALFPTSLNDLLPGGTTANQTIAKTTLLCKTPPVYGTGNPAPNGSGAGKAAITAESTAAITVRGCITFSRSSSPPNPTTSHTTPKFDYYAYALDGVAPLVGTNANPTGATRFTTAAAFTLTQLKNIYHCVPGYTTWHTVTGGTAGAINRFWPQSGSGTRAVYGDILGFTPAKTATKGTCSSPAPTHFNTVTVKGTKTNTVPNEENTESGLVYATKVLHETIKDDIFIYSAGKFVSQWQNPAGYGTTKNNRINQTGTFGNFTPTKVELARIKERTAAGATTPNGTPERFVNFTTTSGSRTHRAASVTTAVTVVEANEWYSNIPLNTDKGSQSTSRIPGVRYVFNVCDVTLPGYSICKALVAFDNQAATVTGKLQDGTKSRLCAGNDSTVIIAQGFVPLSTGSGPSPTDNKATATCREYPGEFFPHLATATKYLSWQFNTWSNPTA